MMNFHKTNNSDLTISAIPIPIEEAHEFGIIEVDENWRLTGFVEKPQTPPKAMPNNPKMCLASMGNYIFNKQEICENVESDNVGALIGMLERVVILLLGALGLYSSIALVLTAKSLARFKQLGEKEFAEKYLVGTLISLIIAILALLIIK